MDRPPPHRTESKRDTRVREDGVGHVTENILLARFTEKPLARWIEALLDRKELCAIAPRLGLNPLPGKRLKTMRANDHALLLARTALGDETCRRAVVDAMNAKLDGPLVADRVLAVDEARLLVSLCARLRPESRHGLILNLLASDETAPIAIEALENDLFRSGEQTSESDPDREREEMHASLLRAEHRADKAEGSQKSAERAMAERERGLKNRIDDLQGKVTELQTRLGDKNRECDAIRKEWDTLKGDLRVAFNRAARFKHALDEAKSTSEREAALKDDLARQAQRADIAEAKLEILEYQLDLLELEEEPQKDAGPVGSDPVSEHVLEYIERAGRAPRILVVGGAGKQRAHRERDFAGLLERFGIEGEWRFADYTSWHRELPRLKNDLRGRYDLVFVLHWNRTTFVQKMHDVARAAQVRVRTVPYRGFLSLQDAVREEVDRFVREKS